MGWFRPALAALFALVIAPAAGLVALAVLVVVDPATRETSYALTALVLQLLAEAETDRSAAEEVEAVLAFLYTAIVSIGFVPIVLVAAFGMLARLHSWAFISAATGAVTVLMPLVLRSAFRLPAAATPSTVEMRFALSLFLSGIVAGTVYWFVSNLFRGPRNASPSR